MTESLEILKTELPVLLFRAGVAVLCGGIFGAERELRGKPAGFRTNILICLGSCLYMMVSVAVAQTVTGGRIGDPGRVAAQVVAGIGFLGAGTILRARGHVIGLTSAAMIWLVAAIGLWIGAGYPVSALVLTVLSILTLTSLRSFERRLLGKCILRECRLIVRGDPAAVRERIERALKLQRVPLEALVLRRSERGIEMTFPICTNHPEHRGLLSEVWEAREVEEVATEP
ncbi:MAG: MgtC/SapB family protein [Acidobacteria bacterium]|nr:MgtC/SapB family protein [Acidobacteriota bacterium]